MYFRNYRLRRTWLDKCLNSLDKQHGELSQTLLKSAWQHFYHIYGSIRRKLSWKNFLLVIYKILALLVNTSADEDKYSLINRDNLMQPIQMQLSKEQKTFSELFMLLFLNLDSILNIFLKNVTLIDYIFWKLQTVNNVVRQMSNKSSLRRA